MKKYTGQTEAVQKSASFVYEFLSDFKNFERFLPEQIKEWEAGNDYCRFSIQGLGKIHLTYAERVPNTKIVVQPAYNSGFPVPFYLSCFITQDSNNSNTSAFHFEIEAQVNAMLAMMIDGPLKQFVEIITLRLKNLLNED